MPPAAAEDEAKAAKRREIEARVAEARKKQAEEAEMVYTPLTKQQVVEKLDNVPMFTITTAKHQLVGVPDESGEICCRWYADVEEVQRCPAPLAERPASPEPSPHVLAAGAERTRGDAAPQSRHAALPWSALLAAQWHCRCSARPSSSAHALPAAPTAHRHPRSGDAAWHGLCAGARLEADQLGPPAEASGLSGRHHQPVGGPGGHARRRGLSPLWQPR